MQTTSSYRDNFWACLRHSRGFGFFLLVTLLYPLCFTPGPQFILEFDGMIIVIVAALFGINYGDYQLRRRGFFTAAQKITARTPFQRECWRFMGRARWGFLMLLLAMMYPLTVAFSPKVLLFFTSLFVGFVYMIFRNLYKETRSAGTPA